MLVALLAHAGAAVAEFPAGLKVDDRTGAVTWGDVQIGALHFAPGWQATVQRAAVQPLAGFPKVSDAAHEFRGAWTTGGGQTMTYWQRLRAVGAGDGVEWSASVSSDAPVPTLTLAMNVELPVAGYAGRVIQFDGQPVTFPVEAGDQLVDARTGVRSVVVPTGAGLLRIDGQFDTYLQDVRAYGGASYGLRLHFKPADGELTSAVFTATLHRRTFDATPIDLSKAANTGLRDDGAGGWTHQGPDNDLRMLEPGLRPIGNVPFRVIDAGQNDGRAALVFAGPDRPDLLKQTPTIPVPAVDGARYVYLLHALAWAPREGTVGTVTLDHADGSTTALDVRAGRDVGDWWAPVQRSNGAVAWTAENRSAFVGLYASRFEVPAGKPPVRAVRLTGSGAAVWMVVAMSLSRDDIPLPVEGPTYVTAGPQWRPVEAALDVEPGSALDFSFLADAPAGKHGHLVIRDGRFQFHDRPGEPVRFYGTNLCFSANFPDHATADRVADRIAAVGYNSVRLHHYDHDLLDHAAADSVTLDPEQVDRIDYLVHALKKRGLYVNIDLYTFRETRPGEIPELSGPVRGEYKAAVYLFDSAFNNWAAFARNVMTRRNKYTGLTWAEDPVFVGVCPLNEDPLGVQVSATPRVRGIFEQRFERWLTDGDRPAPPDRAARDKLFAEFLMDVQRAGVRRQFELLRSLGVRAPLTSVNVVSAVSLTPVRAELDYVDNHSYWDHPGFPEREWNLPHSYQNKSATAAGAWVPVGMAASRIAGKPYTVTEVNYCMPNQFRAEGGPLLAAYAGLQDWDAVWRFAYAHTRDYFDAVGPAAGFDVATDPLSLLSERVAALMFLRRDVAPGRREVVVAVNPTNAYREVTGWGGDNFPAVMPRLALHTRVASTFEPDATGPLQAVVDGGKRLPVDDALPAALGVGAAAFDVDAGRFASDTGQIAVDTKRPSLRVVTDRGEAFVLGGEGATLDGDAVSVRDTTGPYTVVYVGALDGRPVRQSNRLLVLHLTDLQNTKTKYRNAAKTLLDQWGELPHLVRAGAADIALRLDAAGAGGRFTAHALDLSGRRTGTVNLTRAGDALVLPARITADAPPALAYEVVRE